MTAQEIADKLGISDSDAALFIRFLRRCGCTTFEESTGRRPRTGIVYDEHLAALLLSLHDMFKAGTK